MKAKNIPFFATVAVFLLLYIAASIHYAHFFSVDVFVNFFTDNAVLGIAAIGMTFVIISGGIDLSVGSLVGLVSILMAIFIEKNHWPPALAALGCLLCGVIFGWVMGWFIQRFALPPFLVTLAGMFFARGLGFVLQIESIPISHPLFAKFGEWRLKAGAVEVPATALAFLAVLLLGLLLAHRTAFGRNVYALGGNEQSSLLMGLPVGKTKIRVYALSGFCSAAAGIVYTLYTSSGNPTAGSGLELDAIAAVVIGGTLLTGGVGLVLGTLIGVLISGIIQTIITFQGTLSSWWTKMAIGFLLLLFILLQKLLQRRRAKSSAI